MTNKPTPDEVLAYWSKQAIFGHGSPQAELRDALREALRQRDEARRDAQEEHELYLIRTGERDEASNLYAAQSELLAKAFQERDEALAALRWAVKDLLMIQSACGMPDAAEACRRIIKYADETVSRLQKAEGT